MEDLKALDARVFCLFSMVNIAVALLFGFLLAKTNVLLLVLTTVILGIWIYYQHEETHEQISLNSNLIISLILGYWIGHATGGLKYIELVVLAVYTITIQKIRHEYKISRDRLAARVIELI